MFTNNKNNILLEFKRKKLQCVINKAVPAIEKKAFCSSIRNHGNFCQQ